MHAEVVQEVMDLLVKILASFPPAEEHTAGPASGPSVGQLPNCLGLLQHSVPDVVLVAPVPPDQLADQLSGFAPAHVVSRLRQTGNQLWGNATLPAPLLGESSSTAEFTYIQCLTLQLNKVIRHISGVAKLL